MRHLLLTRYNIPIDYKGRSPQRHPLDPQYLEQRHELFQRFCVPSIIHQTCKEFEWIVFFHPDTPSKYYDFLENFATVQLASSMGECTNFAREKRDPNGPTITSRIDNDDAIAETFMAEIQEAVRASQTSAPYVVAFPLGAVANLQKGRFYEKNDVGNPFVTLVEPEGVPRTVWSFQHGKAQAFPVVQIKNRDPMWLSVIHETNVINQRMKWPWFWQTRPNERLAARFPGFDRGFGPTVTNVAARRP